MKRLALTVITAAVLIVPAATIAQSPSPEMSPEPPPLGVDTMDVCLSITGPVTLLTAETLTQGIIDGTFVIEGLSTACESPLEDDPSASPMAPDGMEESGSPAPSIAP